MARLEISQGGKATLWSFLGHPWYPEQVPGSAGFILPWFTSQQLRTVEAAADSRSFPVVTAPSVPLCRCGCVNIKGPDSHWAVGCSGLAGGPVMMPGSQFGPPICSAAGLCWSDELMVPLGVVVKRNQHVPACQPQHPSPCWHRRKARFVSYLFGLAPLSLPCSH